MVCGQAAEGEKEIEIDSHQWFNRDVVIALYKCVFCGPLGLYNKIKTVNNSSSYILGVVLKPIALTGSISYLFWS